jgi:diguanylate cyclase (GGDEF)-like protein
MEPTILIAEDDTVSRIALQRRLEGWGYRVAVVGDGEAAWEALRADNAPPIAILDWTMPGLDGLEVCRRLRLNQTDHYTYVILLSAREEKSAIVTALQAGVDDYLVKPCEWNQLEARLVVALRILSLQAQLISTREQLRQEASHDPLTGLWNRRAATAGLRRDLARAARTGEPLAVLLADIDRFKTINDTWGHPVGDRVLVETAERLRRTVRDSDSIARWGGEELLIVLPDTDVDAAFEVAERVRQTVCGVPFAIDGDLLPVTLSMGITVTHEATADGWDDLLRHADEALYRAKASGRNRVEMGTVTGALAVPPGRKLHLVAMAAG